ncbi:ParB/RepB/Spo0J family partition protein [Burkholderia multivorans]|uniref:ParB/RepB/Spo0J family partition protein n=2 Tax=Burkholderia multivorans TaxID=87883 RepID=UPI00084172F1|nr:ParB/RepB/Spo0J family partition protein [Burkholderia multivorans]AOK67882.1 hypothetical protein WM33_20340 [Burkholderia multivorans]
MALDLSMLDEPRTHTVGAVLDLPIDEIEEDPDQPRKTFSQASLDAMAKRIREKGQVEVPVTVRPKRQGKYRLVDGARRYRSSCIAGMPTIRAIIEADHVIDPYTQVVVNLQREALAPMELAQFIAGRRAAGDSLGTVADALGLSGGDVTAHLSLLDAPASIVDAFQAERIRSVHGVYGLCRLHAQHAEAVEAFMAEHVDHEITRSMIRRLQEAVRHEGEPVAGDAQGSAVNQPEVFAEGDPSVSDLSGPSALPHEGEGGASPPTGSSVHALPFHNPDIERVTKPPKPDVRISAMVINRFGERDQSGRWCCAVNGL